MSLHLVQEDNGSVIKQCSKGIYGTAYIFPHRTISCVSQDNLCNAWSQCILHSLCHRHGKEARESRWNPILQHSRLRQQFSYPTKPLKGAWHTMCHNIQTHTTIHPPVFLDNSHLCFVFVWVCVCVWVCVSSALLCWVCVCIPCMHSLLFSHARKLFSLSPDDCRVYCCNLWFNVYAYLYAINTVGTRLSAGVLAYTCWQTEFAWMVRKTYECSYGPHS